MIQIEIPGRETLEIDYLVLDYNGTIAVNGQLLDGVSQRFDELAKQVKLFVLTADTYGTVREALKDLPVEVETFPQGQASRAKLQVVEGLGASRCACVGNGYNDRLMFQVAALAVAVLEGEGLSIEALTAADVMTRSINEALDLILSPDRLRASLRH